MSETKELETSTEVANPLEPFVITPCEFEEAYKLLPENKVFVFARYKARWVPVIAEFNNGNIRYFFFDDPKLILMSECISGINVPMKPADETGIIRGSRSEREMLEKHKPAYAL